MFLPTKSAACNALSKFLPDAGLEYAVQRNYDNGPDTKASVSKLSPWIRIRLLPEWEVVTAVLEQHSPADASKFIDEVCWRTYWKGWLQMRPSVWQNYLNERAALLEDFRSHVGYQRAIEGRTGIECFDSWNQELLDHNYLHNHARMWYASIWIHTLKLPWQLGADWFLRHLLDGDPASNTLSWRWVAGLQTRGKTYLARPDNIRKYTSGRFRVEESLSTEALELDEAPPPKPMSLPDLTHPQDGLKLGLLLTEEDLSAAEWLPEQNTPSSMAKYFPTDHYEALDICPEVVEFRRKALGNSTGAGTFETPRELVEWAKREQLDGIITAEPTIGHWPEILKLLKAELAAENIELFTARHWWDQTLFPHATKGFFRFKKAIPKVLEKLAVQPA
ncbi:DNA photolyase [Coraliomargarita sinensis]|uniref:DNA photolyase n=1 Tax=Coraliomargarita sinensis TaxID=2174842 RepID=A0A317ZMJ2_9BACT|nr:FAD-binding domain-containing protein [Coraliomargarita sinensis]PXA05039.1 DNA photolyase [Coraliomargarita sinensis]